MEIILLENILNLGNIGDKVKVKNGAKLLQVNENSQNFEYEIMKK